MNSRIWVTTVPPLEPTHLSVLIGVDTTGDPGERLVAALLDHGQKGDDGAFYLLPDDLEAVYEQDGPRLSVRLTALPSVLNDLVDEDADLHEARSRFEGSARITLIHRELESTFLDGFDPDERPPVLVIDAAGPADRDELLAAVDRGEASIAVVPTS
ncbi:hypothetical protein [Catenuloplanes japonicus]|uniref:hypothetical protein n=1 Tax=Catenuloplanes japonicus TaxID=33876 RepID=UPI00068B815F|nr:hypothetical protein [Catenuloplanes japonicus]